ncbi:unnamed protein product [Miscanthus lutarioriparius]|uniref:Uncharacterized protein n=1 Tax=Miscanthus lutarioriparius TaxID=422564 RepID=A0A811QPE7_9POAL|nr:unnamed protein product [Miscanthus lutarioriparius]
MEKASAAPLAADRVATNSVIEHGTWHSATALCPKFALLAMKTDSHETNMKHEVKAVADKRMKHYKVICFLGVALITWIDKAVLLNRLNECNNVAAQVCTIYFTIALVSMLLGLTASSFPDSALCAKTVSSNGALQAFLLLNAVVHLHNMDLYPKVLHLGVSWMLTSLVFCIYWAM